MHLGMTKCRVSTLGHYDLLTLMNASLDSDMSQTILGQCDIDL